MITENQNDVCGFTANKLQEYAVKTYANEENVDIETLSKSPRTFLIRVQTGKIPLVDCISIIKKNPEVMDLSFQGLNFLHYLMLNDDYSYVREVFRVCISMGLKTIPPTGSVVSNTKYTPNQSMLDFIHEQDCYSSFMAFIPYINDIKEKQIETLIVSSAFHGKAKWMKIFKDVYGGNNVENFVTNYFIRHPDFVLEPLIKVNLDLEKLKANFGIDFFKEVNNRSIIAGLLVTQGTFKNHVRERLAYFVNSEESDYGVLGHPYEKFLINLVEHKKLNTQAVVLEQNGESKINVGKILEYMIKREFIDIHQEALLRKLDERIMQDERDVLQKTMPEQPKQKTLKF